MYEKRHLYNKIKSHIVEDIVGKGGSHKEVLDLLRNMADSFDPYEKHHSTVKDACELGERLGVKNLLLYHTEDKNLADRKRLYAEEGSQYYRGNLLIPDDLETVEI